MYALQAIKQGKHYTERQVGDFSIVADAISAFTQLGLFNVWPKITNTNMWAV